MFETTSAIANPETSPFFLPVTGADGPKEPPIEGPSDILEGIKITFDPDSFAMLRKVSRYLICIAARESRISLASLNNFALSTSDSAWIIRAAANLRAFAAADKFS